MYAKAKRTRREKRSEELVLIYLFTPSNPRPRRSRLRRVLESESWEESVRKIGRDRTGRDGSCWGIAGIAIRMGG